MSRRETFSDDDLRACTRGDKAAWNRFVERHAGLIFAAVQRAILSRGANPAEIDDRVQDVFVRLIQNDFRLLKTFDARRASMSTWLTLVARSIAHEHFKKRTLAATRLAVEPAAVADGMASHEPAELSLPAGLLTDRQQVVLQMLFEQGLTVEQAAARLEVDPQTIRSTKHKALMRLREELPNPSLARGSFRGDDSSPPPPRTRGRP